jgi:integrase
VIGSRPSTMRPLRRRGPNADILWDEGILLIRRSNSLGTEIMDQAKTALDQELPLPPAVIAALKEHVDSLEGEMVLSDYLFPSVTGGLRARSVLDKPFRAVLKALKWEIRLTPRGMRRTFQDLARKADVRDLIVRAISGHATDRMQRHYSTAQREEMQEAIGWVATMLNASS